MKKLAGLGKGHSFLSSHPRPHKRAERLLGQLEGRGASAEENKENMVNKLKEFVYNFVASIMAKLSALAS